METIAAKDLKPGDFVDLEGDKYADPDREHTTFEYEYLIVDAVERETPNCVAVWFDGFDCVGFPPDHPLRVQRETA